MMNRTVIVLLAMFLAVTNGKTLFGALHLLFDEAEKDASMTHLSAVDTGELAVNTVNAVSTSPSNGVSGTCGQPMSGNEDNGVGNNSVWMPEYINAITGWLDSTFNNYICHDNKCEVFFKLWKCQASFIAELVDKGIKITFKIRNKPLYCYTFKAGSSYEITVSRDKFPDVTKKWMKSDLVIELTDMNVEAKKLCFRVEMVLKWVGTMTWPKMSPMCCTI